MNLKRQLSIVRSWLWLAVLCAALAGGAAFIVSRQLPSVYSSDATLLVGTSLSNVNIDSSEIIVAQSLAQTYADLARTRPLLEKVIARLGLTMSTRSLADNVSARVPAGSSFIVVTASAGDAESAAIIANGVAAELLDSVPTIQDEQAKIQQALLEEIKQTQTLIDGTTADLTRLSAIASRTAEQDRQLQVAQDRLVSLRSTKAQLLASVAKAPVNSLSVIEPAIAPIDPVSPRTLFNFALGVAIGLAVAGAIAFFVENLRASPGGGPPAA